MDRQRVSSSNLHSVGYDPDTMVLEIKFQSSGIYRYSGVPEERYLGLMRAGSKGSYFDAYIKNRYPTRKVG
ncbi:KTSC domain-containing protein [bacterium]|nr:KTSC domain-containing protein [bacterium]